jgi:hypothetical protein
MTKSPKPADVWDATWEGARRQILESTLAATPAQRLAWLEEMLELALRAGALERSPARRRI